MDARREQERRSKDVASTNDSTLNNEAIAEGTTPERIQQYGAQQNQHKGQTADNQTGAAPGQVQPDNLVDGYAMTEGEGYAQPQRDETEDYDPTHSGVRHAPNKPGTPTSAPGRDEGSGWAEQVQNGTTTDTPLRRNPAD